jgi:hypothetical protein
MGSATELFLLVFSRFRRVRCGVLVLVTSVAACARPPAPPLTPEQRARIEEQRLRGDLQGQGCPQAMESARAYKSSGTDAFQPSFESRRCLGAQR